VLKLCIHGCDKIEPSGDNQYNLGVSVKIGPVSAKFAGKIALSDIQPPNSYHLGFEGQGGAAGFGKGSAQVSLADHADGCELHYTVHATVGGKIAQMGQRLIDGVAKSMAEDFFKRFDDEMQRRHPAAAAPAAPAAGGAVAQGSMADPLAPALVPLLAALGGAAVMLLLLWAAD
jgi:carbon monoxide dehydrogenase subunit G